MKTAILYIRVSTDEQADTGYSQRQQEETLRRFCDLQGHTIVGVFYEDHSAKNFNRPQFSKMLLHLRKNKNSAALVLFTKWDRFSRNAGDSYQMINTLNKLGVEPQAVEQPLDMNVPENKMMLAFYLASPEVDNDRRALNVFNGMRRARKEGHVMGKAPVGYSNKVSEDGKRKWIAPSEKAGLVQWIFETIATGTYTAESVWKLAKEKGLRLKKNPFWNLLRNPVYCGLIYIPAYKNLPAETVEAKHEPLISRALFYQAQDVLNGKKKTQRAKIQVDDRYPLRGFLQCPDCGKLLTASSSRGRKQYYDYYHCTSACGVRYKADVVNDAFVQELRSWKPHPAIAALYTLILKDVYSQQRNTRTQELSRIKKEMERLTDKKAKALNLLVNDSIGADDFALIKKDCERGLFILHDEMAALTETYNIEPVMEQAMSVLSNLDAYYSERGVGAKRDIVGSMFPEKLIYDGEHFRTSRINEAVRVIYSVGEGLSKIQTGQNTLEGVMSREVTPLVHFSNLFVLELKKIAALAA
jgi:DNA invertase Pin-like site-specific DNA recombinase/predicted RNA-binding Zn-ribbon protein involved in translation (DUF1610 family)